MAYADTNPKPGAVSVVLNEEQPVDGVVKHQIEQVIRRGRGFVLDMAKDEAGKLSIEVKESLPPHDEFKPLVANRAHAIHDTESFVRYSQRYGTKDRSLVMYNLDCAMLILDEWVERGETERVNMPFVASQDWSEWQKIVNRPLKHKELLLFLMAHEHNLTDATMLQAMQSMKMNAQVNVESDIKDDGTSYGIFVKTTAGDELKRFPKEIEIQLSVLREDSTLATPKTADVEAKLQIQLPDDAREGPSFILRVADWDAPRRRRIAEIGEQLRSELADWTVVQGAYSRD